MSISKKIYSCSGGFTAFLKTDSLTAQSLKKTPSESSSQTRSPPFFVMA